MELVEVELEPERQGRFFNKGKFAKKFRKPYSKSEERAMVTFFLNEGGYQNRKGRAIWMKMESMKICNGRTWQSMKGRWENYVSKDLKKFNISEEDLKKADCRIYENRKGMDEEIEEERKDEEEMELVLETDTEN